MLLNFNFTSFKGKLLYIFLSSTLILLSWQTISLYDRTKKMLSVSRQEGQEQEKHEDIDDQNWNSNLTPPSIDSIESMNSNNNNYNKNNNYNNNASSSSYTPFSLVTRPYLLLFGDSLTQHSVEANGFSSLLLHTYGRKGDIRVRGVSGLTTRGAVALLDGVLPLPPPVPSSSSYHPTKKEKEEEQQQAEHAEHAEANEDKHKHKYNYNSNSDFNYCISQTIERPSLVTLFFGANDAVLKEVEPRQHVSLEEYGENLQMLIDRIKTIVESVPSCEHGKSEEHHPPPHQHPYIMLITPPPLLDSHNRKNKITRSYATKVKLVGAANPSTVRVLDLFTAMHGNDGDTPSLRAQYLLKDGLHFNKEGNAFLYGKMMELISQAFPQVDPKLLEQSEANAQEVNY